MTPELIQQHASIVKRFHQVRGDCQGALAGGERLVVSLQISQNIGSVGERLSVLRPDGNGLVVALQRFGMPSQVVQYIAAVVERFRKRRLDHERLVEALQRFVVPLEVAEHVPTIAQRVRRAGIDVNGSAEQADRLVLASALGFKHAQQMQRIKLLGLRLKDESVNPLGLRIVARSVGGMRVPKSFRQGGWRATHAESDPLSVQPGPILPRNRQSSWAKRRSRPSRASESNVCSAMSGRLS